MPRPDRRLRRAVPMVVMILLPAAPAAHPHEGTPAAPAGAEPEAPSTLPPLDLAAVLREARANNPEIAAARSRAAAAASVVSQAETLPDPFASVSYQNESFTSLTFGDTADSFLGFSWTQEVPYPGKLRLGGDVARRETEIAERRLRRAWLEVSSRIKQAYADLYRLDRTASILEDSRELLVSFLGTARARYESGEGLLENVLKAQTEITRLDAELEVLAQERRSAQAALNALAGRAEDAPLGPAASLPGTSGALEPGALVQDALDRSPEIQEMEAGVLRDEARLELARRQLKPDLMWGASYFNRGDLDPMIMGTFGLRLPLHRQDKQAQGIVQARHEVDASRQDVASVRLKVAADVRDLAARAERAGTLSRLYAEGIVPQARTALESASAAYGVGRADFLMLLDDFNRLLTFEIEHERQRSERVAALAALERLTGRDLVPVAAPGEGLEGEFDE